MSKEEKIDSRLLSLELRSAIGRPEGTTIGAIGSTPPGKFIMELVSARAKTTENLFERIRKHFASGASNFPKGDPSLFAAYHDKQFLPINPLLLASAIATSLVRGTDYSSFLQRYALGDELHDLEKLYVLYEGDDFNWIDHKELLKVLPLESLFVEAMLELGVELLIERGSLLHRDNDGLGDYYVSYFQAFWAAWLIVNPAFDASGFSEPNDARLTLGSYGFHRNSAVHNVREFYETQEAFLDNRINEFLSGNDLDKKSVLLDIYMEMKSNATALVERARRFYYWLPHEITAFSAELAAMDPEQRGSVYPQFLLPDSIYRKVTRT
jgi:hypothetical protein